MVITFLEDRHGLEKLVGMFINHTTMDKTDDYVLVEATNVTAKRHILSLRSMGSSFPSIPDSPWLGEYSSCKMNRYEFMKNFPEDNKDVTQEICSFMISGCSKGDILILSEESSEYEGGIWSFTV